MKPAVVIPVLDQIFKQLNLTDEHEVIVCAVRRYVRLKIFKTTSGLPDTKSFWLQDDGTVIPYLAKYIPDAEKDDYARLLIRAGMGISVVRTILNVAESRVRVIQTRMVN